MTIQEFRNYMASGKPIEGGSDVHMMFHRLSQEALRITAEINGNIIRQENYTSFWSNYGGVKCLSQ